MEPDGDCDDTTGHLRITSSLCGGIAAVNSTATTLTQTAVTTNQAGMTVGGVYRQGGTMTTNRSSITANTPNNCVDSVPAVPNCTN
ncbi:MAG TPA: hypothetical protein VJT72_14100 [Pseudonocardiaceae bacterium]|nr:hypothetical protein [Pseudonocardiaceae bacterium]